MKTNCNCNYCGKDIYKPPNQLKKYKSHYCNSACAINSRKVRETRECIVCGEKVTRKPSEFIGNAYCSRDCYHHSNKSEVTGISSKINCKCFYCGKSFKRYPSQIKDKKYTYCDTNCKNKHNGELFRGANHHRWNPELTEEQREYNRKNKKYIKWRSDVYKGDGYSCRCCGDNQGGNLVAHHILNFSEHESLRYDVENGITLCEVCHKGFHDNYGYTKNNKKQLDDFFKRQANQLPITPATV